MKVEVLSHRERDENYRNVVAVLSPSWRVIRCKDGSQWILQRNVAGRSRRAEWRSVSYTVTREALLRLGAASCSRIDPSAWAVLTLLPDFCGGLGHV